jgi:hypothetical protein
MAGTFNVELNAEEKTAIELIGNREINGVTLGVVTNLAILGLVETANLAVGEPPDDDSEIVFLTEQGEDVFRRLRR